MSVASVSAQGKAELARRLERARFSLVILLILLLGLAWEAAALSPQVTVLWQDPPLIFAALALALFSTLLRHYLLAPRATAPPRFTLAAACWILLDLGWMVLLLFGTGGWDSPFRLLPLLAIPLAATHCREQRGALQAAAWSVGLLYLALGQIANPLHSPVAWEIPTLLLVGLATARVTGELVAPGTARPDPGTT